MKNIFFLVVKKKLSFDSSSKIPTKSRVILLWSHLGSTHHGKADPSDPTPTKLNSNPYIHPIKAQIWISIYPGYLTPVVDSNSGMRRRKKAVLIYRFNRTVGHVLGGRTNFRGAEITMLLFPLVVFIKSIKGRLKLKARIGGSSTSSGYYYNTRFILHLINAADHC